MVQDGPVVFAHTAVRLLRAKIGFGDIFRFEDGTIVEHWDNLRPRRDRIAGGPDRRRDQKLTLTPTPRSAKQLISAFVDDILVNGRMEKATGYRGERYLQHNPRIGDDLSGLGAAPEAMARQNITMKYDRIHTVLGEGDFVLVVSEGEFAGTHSSFYDLFRVENGKIAEHWDTIEAIPKLHRMEESERQVRCSDGASNSQRPPGAR